MLWSFFLEGNKKYFYKGNVNILECVESSYVLREKGRECGHFFSSEKIRGFIKKANIFECGESSYVLREKGRECFIFIFLGRK